MKISSEERFCCYLLHAIDLSPNHIRALRQNFTSAKSAITESGSLEWQALRFSTNAVESLRQLQEQGRLHARLAKEYEEARAQGFEFLVDEEIANLFVSLGGNDVPFGIWVHGKTSILFSAAAKVAIVGTRRPSFYGKAVCADIAKTLGKLSVVVVSGLARGIDTIAHQNAMEAGADTIGVLGTGLNCFYPPENKKLQREIIPSQGLVLSEFPLTTNSNAFNFPRRNRLIAALSLGIVVVEGDNKSGALITARSAALQGKDVFAVPGNINSPMSYAPNLLIKEGAVPLTNVNDLAEAMPELQSLSKSLNNHHNGDVAGEINRKDLEPRAKKILSVLSSEPMALDAILNSTGLGLDQANQILLELELSGLILNCSPFGYATR